MNIHIDKAGRLVLPKAVRQSLGITPESSLECVPTADGVLLRVVADRSPMERVDGLCVHRGIAPPAFDWTGAVDSVGDDRADAVWPT